ncbi:MAG: chemotaxis protein CheW, partial [Candidatus Xenobia bacterium]
CSFLELPALSAVTQATVNLLTALRDGSKSLTETRLDALCDAHRALNELLGHLEAHGQEGGSSGGVVQRLQEALADPAPGARPDALSLDSEMLADFQAEIEENLALSERTVAQLRVQPHDATALAALYRAFHSMRAACQFFSFQRFERLARAVEEMLLPSREGGAPLASASLDLLLAAVASLREHLQRIQATGREGEREDEALLQRLRGSKSPSPVPAPAPSPPPPPPPPAAPPVADDLVAEFLDESRELLEAVERDLVALERGSAGADAITRIFRGLHTIKGSAGLLGYSALQSLTHAGESLLGRLRDGQLTPSPPLISALLACADAIRGYLDGIPSGRLEADFGSLVATLEALKRGEAAPVVAAAPAPVALEAAHVETSLRVDVGLLDRLMTLVGELVLARNQLVARTRQSDNHELLKSSQYLSVLTTQLQEGIMKTRMQPLEHLWSKYPRLVRDVAHTCGKAVRLVMEGAHTELDRSLLEAIRDPMVHLLRNAIDHGLEPPEVRSAAGKPEEGTLTLSARHQGGLVHIDIADDGRGIDVDRVRQVAVQRGMVTTDQAARLSRNEVFGLIMQPGFSTAEKVTEMSGRGVGMDVVRANIEAIGGSLEIASEAGRGTTFHLHIPLTLAIMPALMVTAGGQRFALPQMHLLEVMRLADAGRLERISGHAVLRRGDSLLPLFPLASQLGLSASDYDTATLVLLHADVQHFGLIVDAVHDTEEIVVKPLGRLLGQLEVFSGAAILGDGGIVLIIDVPALAVQAHAIAPGASAPAPAPVASAAVPGRQYVLLQNRCGERFALELADVSRLERFSRRRIEQSGAQEVVVYHDRVLPLLSLETICDTRQRVRDAEEDEVSAVVCEVDGRAVGVVARSIVDIVQDTPHAISPGTRAGVLYRAVVSERVVEMLDLHHVCDMAYPS